MDSGEEELVTLFYEVMDGARYLYDGRSFSQSMEGEGLVLTMPKTCLLYTSWDEEVESSGSPPLSSAWADGPS